MTPELEFQQAIDGWDEPRNTRCGEIKTWDDICTRPKNHDGDHVAVMLLSNGKFVEQSRWPVTVEVGRAS